MGGANTGTNKIGQAQLAAGTVPKATLATQSDLAAFDRQQAQGKRIAQGLDFFAKGIQNMNFDAPVSQALESKKQLDAYQEWLKMQEESSNNLILPPRISYQIRSSNPELVSKAWGNAGKDIAGSMLGAVGTMYGRK